MFRNCWKRIGVNFAGVRFYNCDGEEMEGKDKERNLFFFQGFQIKRIKKPLFSFIIKKFKKE